MGALAENDSIPCGMANYKLEVSFYESYDTFQYYTG